MKFVLPRPNEIHFPGPAPGEDPELRNKLRPLTERFDEAFHHHVAQLQIPPLVVRARLPCNASFILDQSNLWIVGDVARGVPLERVFFALDQTFPESEIERAARWELGHDDPFIVRVPRYLADLPPERTEEVTHALGQAAEELIAREYHRFVSLTQTIRLRPLFGDPPMQAKPHVCFVIAPFAPERTEIYEEYIKPTVEENGLVCLRADDLRTNRAVIENIWQSICEARFLIEERPDKGSPPKRAFDTMGIDAILYKNTAIGGKKLSKELDTRIKQTLARVVIPSDQLDWGTITVS